MEPAGDAVTFAIDTQGVVCGWSTAAGRLFGFRADEIVGRPARELTPQALLEAGAAVETEALRSDGSRVWIALTVTPAAGGELTCRAREAPRRREPAVLSSDLAVRRHASEGVITVDRAAQVIEINAAAERLLGCPRESALGRPLDEVLGDPTVAARVFAGAAVRDERRDGETPTLLRALPLHDAAGEIVGGTAIITDLSAAVQRERVEYATQVVERTSRALGESLDLDATLDRCVDAFVPEFADVCVISSLEADGSLAIRATGGSEPDLHEAARALCGTRRAPDEVKLDGGHRYAHRHVTVQAAHALAKNDAEALVADSLGAHWQTVVGLRARNRVWGVVVLLTRDSRPEPTEDELRLIQELAQRCGQALENARLYALATEAQARFTAAFEQAPIGMALIDREGIVTSANPALAGILGRDGLAGSPLPELAPHEPGERRILTAAGQAVWVQMRLARLGADGETVVLVQDITDRKRYEGELQYLADHDPLTGLYNRRRFAEELEWVLAYSRRYHSPAAVVALDVDNFKFVNDTFGHATGDELLVAIGAALRARCRESDIVGRLGGDEFGVVLPQSGSAEADIVAQALLDAVREVRVMFGDRPVEATASIGVRVFGEEAELTAQEILSDADIALYDAKESGRDRKSVTGENRVVTDRLRARISWTERIRDALNHDGFVLYEQPILNLAQGEVVASELLLRMRAANGGVIVPGEFLETAERFGQIQAIDRWVIEQAVRLLAERQAAGLAAGLEVNLSGGSISDATVIDFIVSEVRNAPIDPRGLTIEVTETAAIVNIERARALAQSLADLGCRFALDDFGSGFGSFYYLKHLPFDVIKIDGEFVRDLATSRADQLTVKAIVQIAGGLEKPTIAEFVESDATLQALMTLGVDCAQGYHIGRPRPVVAFGA
jgi:diguanylate cyclase (GGDEF)-like protein/PAS domain S-box-containing protein